MFLSIFIAPKIKGLKTEGKSADFIHSVKFELNLNIDLRIRIQNRRK